MSTIGDHGKVWNDCLQYISHRIRKQSFATWLRHTSGTSDGNGGIKINVPNQFVAEWIEEHYAELIDEALTQSCGNEIPFSFCVNKDGLNQTELDFNSQSESVTPQISSAIPVETVRPKIHDGMLNNRYTFDNLVVGNFNQFSYAASLAVAEAPGKTKYNPLYIYGGVGLGKTHLLQAIGHFIVNNNSRKQVIYATSEKFTSDFIDSISSNKTNDFINLYRNVDALLIDDAQFFAGKESTQEQFFHTFNALYNAGKQIVLSSDRAPKDIKGMEERLLSRFSWGLVTDIQAPDLETRMAILRRKVETENIFIGEDVISFIADSVTNNIRELEGSLIRLLAYASLRGEELNLEMAERVLSDTFRTRKRTLTISFIKKKVADNFEIDIEMLAARKKTQNIARARQVAMFISRTLTSNSLESIGDEFGGRDHSTVIHACHLIEKLMKTDNSFKQRVDSLMRSVTK
ncbi:MAG: chromosomal replication initiator protein DnaA [candidate division Zixibacteria bacterium]|nr:chromosomal replication initiator protein DnaA [candidate division Zixibacteria bacterium]